jgi:hypothetical protein
MQLMSHRDAHSKFLVAHFCETECTPQSPVLSRNAYERAIRLQQEQQHGEFDLNLGDGM